MKCKEQSNHQVKHYTHTVLHILTCLDFHDNKYLLLSYLITLSQTVELFKWWNISPINGENGSIFTTSFADRKIDKWKGSPALKRTIIFLSITLKSLFNRCLLFETVAMLEIGIWRNRICWTTESFVSIVSRNFSKHKTVSRSISASILTTHENFEIILNYLLEEYELISNYMWLLLQQEQKPLKIIAHQFHTEASRRGGGNQLGQFTLDPQLNRATT